MMKDNSSNNLEQLDLLFKEGLAEHEVPPPNAAWQHLSEQLAQGQVDHVFRRALAEHEVEPPKEAWAYISKRLPLSLAMRNLLNWLSRVAGLLLVAMLGILYFTQWGKDATSAPAPQQPYEMPRPSEPGSNSTTPAKAGTDKEVAGEKDGKAPAGRASAAERLLNPGFEVDEERIQDALKPLERLPLDAPYALKPKKGKKEQEGNAEDKPLKENN